jgi:predicted ABC-type ATPase
VIEDAIASLRLRTGRFGEPAVYVGSLAGAGGSPRGGGCVGRLLPVGPPAWSTLDWMTARAPLVIMVAGPNGAGKSTMAARLLQDALTVSEFVNADPIASGLSAFRPQSVAMAAGRVMLARMKALAEARQDFAFETTLASRSFAPWLVGLRRSGYRAHLAFLSLSSSDLAVARVAERVRQGGHDVPQAVVRRRFAAGLRNFFTLYVTVVDSWRMFDNSAATGPRLIAFAATRQPANVVDVATWNALQESY